MADETSTRPSTTGAASMADAVYSPVARSFHWWSAAIVLILLPLGFLMTYEGPAFKLSEVVNGRMIATHKLLGFVLLWLVVARLIYRFRKGAPASEPTLEPWEKGVSHATHWTLYALLLAMPISGWIGTSLYGERDLFGPFRIPAITAVDQPLSDKVFEWHFRGAVLIMLLLAAHIGAAIYHHYLRKDGVLRRMLPNIRRS